MSQDSLEQELLAIALGRSLRQVDDTAEALEALARAAHVARRAAGIASTAARCMSQEPLEQDLLAIAVRRKLREALEDIAAEDTAAFEAIRARAARK